MMAYYYSGYYDANPGEYSSSSVTYPGHDYRSYKFHGYDPTPYHDSYNSGSTSYYGSYDRYHPSQSVVSYSAYSSTEAKYIEYRLPQYDDNYSSSTQFVVSYSVSEPKELDDVFEEYDPTPFGGGYDQASTYGKPLPPSDEICYPPSSMADPKVQPSPSAEEKVENFVAKPPSESKPTPTSAPDAEQQPHADDYDSSHDGKISQGEPLDSHREETEAQVIDSNYDYFNPVNQVPPGYGLEAMDICESLFGYWPCLARAKRNGENQEVCEVGSNVNQWRGTADYLFGGSYPYSDNRDMEASSGYPITGYERHQFRHEEDSWL